MHIAAWPQRDVIGGGDAEKFLTGWRPPWEPRAPIVVRLPPRGSHVHLHGLVQHIVRPTNGRPCPWGSGQAEPSRKPHTSLLALASQHGLSS